MCTATPPQGKIALGSRDKITFQRFLSYKNLPLKIYFSLVELALAERDFKNAGLSFLSIFFFLWSLNGRPYSQAFLAETVENGDKNRDDFHCMQMSLMISMRFIFCHD